MKILLLGEYSGFYKNLKEGLLDLGHEVTLLANGDGWKQIEGADGSLYKVVKNPVSKIKEHIIAPLYNIEKYNGYDIVQMVSTNIFNQYVNDSVIKKIIKNNDKVFFSAAGDDYAYYSATYNNTYRYSPLKGEEHLEKKYDRKSVRSKIIVNKENYLYRIVNGIIPITYDYAIAHKNDKNLKITIPLPLNCNNIEYSDNEVHNKIVFFHGLNRENFKGTSFIKQALNIVKEKYPKDVEIIIDGRMPLKKYLSIMQKSNVIIDQCKSYSWGVNALYALAQGKIVMSGCEQETLNHFGLKTCPIINITPNVEDIVKKLEDVIENRKDIQIKGKESRLFVESFHNHKRIAQMYIDCWKNSK